MTLLVEWGALFLAYGAPMAIIWFMVRSSAKLVIMMVTGAFMWLIGALISSIVWVAITPLKDEAWFMVIISVPIQEIMRYLYWKLLRKAETGLNTLASDDHLTITRDRVALVSGLGQGFMAGTLPLSAVLSHLNGPASIPSRVCSNISFGMMTALLSAQLILLHTFWNVIASDAFQKRHERRGARGWGDWRVVYVVLAHYAFSLITLNNDEDGTCGGTLGPIFILFFLSAAIAFFTAGLGRT